MGLMPLTGLSSYGPASLDSAPNLEPCASLGRQDYGPEVGGTGLWKNNLAPAPLPFSESARAEGTLVEPAWMAKGLDSPDVRVRLRALDRWALELIEQDWVREQAAKSEAEK